MSFENPFNLDSIRNKVNRTVNESSMPTEAYESTVGFYGGKLKRNENNELVYNMRGIVSKIDQIGDYILRTYDEHIMRNPLELLKKHPKWFFKFIFPGAKRYRGNPEEIFENIQKLGLEDFYGLHKDGISIKNEEVFTKGIALQDIYRSDLINSERLENIDRFRAVEESAKYIGRVHEKGGIGELLVSDIIFQYKNEENVSGPVLNIPDIVFNKEKETPEDNRKAIDLLDFLMSVGVEEMRRSQEDEESVVKAMKCVLDNYKNRKVISLVSSFIKKGYLTLQGDKDVKEIGLPEDSFTTKNRGLFTKHNEARMGKNDRNYEVLLKTVALGVCEDFLKKEELS